MVYKTKFLKQVVENDYYVGADYVHTWELSDQAMAALWITIKGPLQAPGMCIDDYLLSLIGLDVVLGSFNVVHYTHGIKAYLMNCKLKQHWGYLLNSTQTATNMVGITFPILFGAPYLNDKMCLPASLSNRKKLTLRIDDAHAALTHTYVDISEVIMPDARPDGFIKQEEIDVTGLATGDHDLWLQTNWDLLKLLIYSPVVPTGTAFTSTIERAGLEIDDFPFGYKSVPWEHMHGELMDEVEGSGPVEDHRHLDSVAGACGMPYDLEHWVAHYGELDFFFEKDLKWRAPLAGASTAKLKYNIGSQDDWAIVQANYIPTAKVT